jgi:hypothetical protein
MALKPLEILKKGLKTLQKQVQPKKDQLLARLAEKKPISSQDEDWLDQVEAVLDNLVSAGVLQASNRMDINTLLNPVDESRVMDETTDEEIYQAVIDARRAQEDTIINCGDDDVDDDALVEDRPTRREVLQAASVINRYIDGLHDPVARKLEGLLSSFARQMRLDESRSLVSTRITDYISH